MLVAGLHVPDDAVLALVVLLRRGGFAHTADTLDGATAAGLAEVALTAQDRIAILRVLDEPPTEALAALRGSLLSEHDGPSRDALG